MTIPVIWLEAHPLCWDQAIVDQLLAGPQFAHHDGATSWAPTEGAVVVCPARYPTARKALRQLLAELPWAVVLLTSDEESTYPWPPPDLPNVRWWVQSPRPAIHAGHDRFLPVGAPPGTREALAGAPDDKSLDWFFAGQITHERRQQCAEALRGMANGALIETPGFTQGLERSDYVRQMAGAKVVPCPSGPASLDTFRLWEALTAGCVPIADADTPPPLDVHGSWDLIAPGAPWLITDNWYDLPYLVDRLVADWPNVATRTTAWWLTYQRDLRRRLHRDIEELSGQPCAASPLTVLIPTSPIPEHPSTATLEQTVDSVRYWHPDADVILMCDGVRRAQKARLPDYSEYLHRVSLLCQRRWSNVSMLIFDECRHQAEMTREALAHVDTPLVMFVEHDTPLVTDEPIEWDAITAMVLTGEADLVRLHHEALVLPDHEHLMLDAEPKTIHGAPFRRTVQWSQRPHVAAASFYRRLLDLHFADHRRTMIEDVMHAEVHNAWRQFGLAGWDRFRLWMYTPPGNYKRSYHLDGRGTDQKWVEG